MFVVFGVVIPSNSKCSSSPVFATAPIKNIQVVSLKLGKKQLVVGVRFYVLCNNLAKILPCGVVGGSEFCITFYRPFEVS